MCDVYYQKMLSFENAMNTSIVMFYVIFVYDKLLHLMVSERN